MAAVAAEFQRRWNLPATPSLSTRVLFFSRQRRQIWRRETEARTVAMVAELDGDNPSRVGSRQNGASSLYSRTSMDGDDEDLDIDDSDAGSTGR
ncbi:uncharacterized protein DS421_11g330520 [Arachis hypogaea]|nr:uncharacterized protein DS421_11g330520 [Arachis hypogaea]